MDMRKSITVVAELKRRRNIYRYLSTRLTTKLVELAAFTFISTYAVRLLMQVLNLN